MPSTVIASYKYDEKEQVLTIRFVTGLVYRYKKVPTIEYKNFCAAFSKGTYFNKHIKGYYLFEKVS